MNILFHLPVAGELANYNGCANRHLTRIADSGVLVNPNIISSRPFIRNPSRSADTYLGTYSVG